MHTYVFANDLLQSARQILPVEDLDVLLDIAGLGIREGHDDLEELLAIGLPLGNRQRAEALQVPPYPILLLYRKPSRHQLFQQVDGVDAGHETLVLLLPVNAADADALGGPVFRCNRVEAGRDGAA